MCLTTTQILRAQVGMDHRKIPSKQHQKSKINHWNNKKEKRETIGKPKRGSYGRTAENKDATRIGIEEIVVIELMMLFLLAVALSCLIVPCYHLLVVVERKIESVIGEGHSWLGCCTYLRIGVCSDLVYLGPCIHSEDAIFLQHIFLLAEMHTFLTHIMIDVHVPWLSWREKDHRQVGRTGEEPVRSLRRERSFSGSLTSTAERAVPDYRPANGVQAVTSKPVAGIPISTLLHHHSVYYSF